MRDFSETRTRLARHVAYVKTQEGDEQTGTKLKLPTKESGWCKFCFGEKYWAFVKQKRKDLEEEGEKELQAEAGKTQSPPKTSPDNLPLLHIISEFRQTQVTKLIEYIVDWCELTGEVDTNQALWIYSLMAAVEKPLHPDVQSALRSVVLVCSNQRMNLCQDESTTKDFSHLNLIICLVAKYFGQADLSD